MAYETYTTEALVCGTFNKNTADRSFLLFTREAGMLYASARSVREERSRQRYALQDFSYLRVSLVKGKSGWRVGSIESQQNFYQIAVDKTARQHVVGVFRLLRRFLQGEVVDHDLFDYVVAALIGLSAETEQSLFVELAVKVHVLSRLGYVNIKLIPTELRRIPPQEIKERYSVQNEEKLNELYTHAISVSHL